MVIFWVFFVVFFVVIIGYMIVVIGNVGLNFFLVVIEGVEGMGW